MPGPVDRPLLPAGFEFVRVLGVGADGWVCLARDRALDRLVAVKTVLGGALVPGGSARLAREGRVLASLRHPHVVRVHRLVEQGPDAALCEEFVDGCSLAEAMGEPRHPLWEGAARVRLLGEVAEALDHCAQHGIVHRDLKPGNILLTRAGSAKVADFGLARLSRAAAAFRTAPGVVSGTPGYIAPEQVRDPDREHPATDYYSFAVVALECLTGQRAGRAGPEPLLARVPADLRPAFQAGLSPDPDSRWPPSRLVRAVVESGWCGTAWTSSAGPGPVVTAQAAAPTATVTGPTVPQSLHAPAALEQSPSGHRRPDPDPLVMPSDTGAVALVAPATVPLARPSWRRRHPLVVGLAAGALLATAAVALVNLVLR